MKNILTLVLLFINLFLNAATDTPLYFVTGANSPYFPHLLNLIGSIHKVNFDQLGQIAVFNLGLSQTEIEQLNRIDKLTIYEIEPSSKHLLQYFTLPNGYRVFGWFAWKPVIIKQALETFPYVLWVDAGTTILKPVDNLFKHLKENGYCLFTIGNELENGKFKHPLEWGITKFVKDNFHLETNKNKWILSQEFVMGGINGTTREHIDKFILPLYEMAKDLRYYQDDGTAPNGFGTSRHDQTLLSILAYQKGLTIHKQDYTQQLPIKLSVDNKEEPFYITWHPGYASEKTHIYSSRGDLSNKNLYATFIHYK